MTTNISKSQIGRLHALAAKAGLKDGTHEDNYHALLYTQTGKTSTKDLTYPEFLKMERHLGGTHGWSSPPKAPKPAPDGMIPSYMIKTAWGLFYELKRMDASPPPISDRERMKAIIKRALKIDTTLDGDLFKWITYEQGNVLLRTLRNMIAAAKKRGVT